jgi:hypothetical protein
MTPFGASPQKPPKKPPEPAKPPSPPSQGDGCSTVAFFVLAAIIFFLVRPFVVPHLTPDKKEIDADASAREAVAKTLSVSFPTASVRLNQIGGENLEVWISQKEFESVAYLDRKTLMDLVGKQWCEKVSISKCPTVVVRNEKTGANLAIYHCMFSYSDLNPN